MSTFECADDDLADDCFSKIVMVKLVSALFQDLEVLQVGEVVFPAFDSLFLKVFLIEDFGFELELPFLVVFPPDRFVCNECLKIVLIIEDEQFNRAKESQKGKYNKQTIVIGFAFTFSLFEIANGRHSNRKKGKGRATDGPITQVDVKFSLFGYI